MIDQETKNRICELIADGQSLRGIVLAEDGMPSRATVFKELAADHVFADQYARAREAQADTIFDEILKIADESQHDTYIDEDGNTRTNQEVVARSKLRVDARKWMAGKLRPKVYGDKLNLQGDPDNPLALGLTVTFK